MKKNILLLVLLIITAGAGESFCNVTPGLLKEKRNSQWNNTNWDLRTIQQYDYYENYQKKTVTQLKQYQGMIINDTRNSYLYDDMGLVTEVLVEVFQNEGWESRYKYTYSYNLSNLTNSVIIEEWDGGRWINYYKTEYQYNSSDQLESSISYTYQNNNWVNSSAYYLTYTSFGNVSEQIEKAWNGDTWSDYRKYIYQYNENQAVSQFISQTWKTKWWVNESKTDYSFDEFNRIKESQTSTWQTDAWFLSGKTEIGYDQNGNIQQELSSLYYYGNWENRSKTDYEYFGTTSVNSDNDYTLPQLNVFPNPTSDNITIKYRINQITPVRISLCDFTGKIIKDLYNGTEINGEFIKTANTKDLAQGNYIIQMLSNMGIVSIPLKIIR